MENVLFILQRKSKFDNLTNKYLEPYLIRLKQLLNGLQLGTVKWGKSEHLKFFQVVLKLLSVAFSPIFCRNHGTKNSTSCFKT